MARMEKKSKVYDQMKRGDYSGISDAQLAELPFEVCVFAIWRLKSSDSKYSPMRDCNRNTITRQMMKRTSMRAASFLSARSTTTTPKRYLAVMLNLRFSTSYNPTRMTQ